MIDYSTMTNEELDVLTADRFGIDLRVEHIRVLGEDRTMPIEFWYIDGKQTSMNWNPTDSESNQVERYLFPKLREKGLQPTFMYGQVSNEGEFFHRMIIWKYDYCVCQKDFFKDEDINRIRAITALVALGTSDKLKR